MKKTKKALTKFHLIRAFRKRTGGVLLSHIVSHAVPSTLKTKNI